MKKLQEDEDENNGKEERETGVKRIGQTCMKKWTVFRENEKQKLEGVGRSWHKNGDGISWQCRSERLGGGAGKWKRN